RDFQNADTRMLLVLGAQAAVERATPLHFHANHRWQPRRQREFHPVVPAHVRTDKILPLAMLRARLAEIDPPVASDNFCGHHRQPLRTETWRRYEQRSAAWI